MVDSGRDPSFLANSFIFSSFSADIGVLRNTVIADSTSISQGSFFFLFYDNLRRFLKSGGQLKSGGRFPARFALKDDRIA